MGRRRLCACGTRPFPGWLAPALIYLSNLAGGVNLDNLTNPEIRQGGFDERREGQQCSEQKGFSRLRQLREQILAGQTQNPSGLFARDAIKIGKKLVERVISFKIVKKGLDGHSRTVEARRAAKPLAVDPHQAEQGMVPLDQVPGQKLRRTDRVCAIHGRSIIVDIDASAFLRWQIIG